MARDPAEALSLWRYHLIAEALSPKLSAKERGRIVRRLAGEEHVGPDGEPRRVSRNTFDRWIRAYRQRGLAGLRDQPRSDTGSSKRHPELIEEAVRLRQERPDRSAAHIAEMLRVSHGVHLAERTLRGQFEKRGLTRDELLRDRRTWGRYEASAPNERWIADVLVGPFVPFPRAPGSQRARLFLIVDDHSRLVVHGRWCPFEKLRSGQEVLHAAILRRGLPEQLYVDNGAAFAGQELGRCCAASSTAFYLAMELSNQRELVVVTNGLRTAIALLRKPHITVILPGGVLRSEAVSLVGELGEDILKRTRIQKGFFSGRGLTPDDGLMDLSPEETRLKRAMVGQCSELIALVDHTKWQRGALLSVASPKQISTVVTDWKTPVDLIEAWRNRGTKVIVGEQSSNGA